jgi:eukaryotic-like serine/threonine-protein kinase
MEPVVAPRTYSERYEVTHLIARGGMAQVYRALDLRLGRHVALKVLFPELSIDRTFVERFRREAQAAANLSHPNIVAVYDWGEDEGAYFIAMELITGTSLATALRAETTLPATRAAAIAAQVAGALSYAHRHGVVHRDIKPGNVLLTEDGQVKVTDFGIAQAVSTEEGLTMAGSVMGTAAYFSPEQAEGALVDGRSDLYSLGVVLYEMLAGRPPFVGDSPVAVASMHVRNAPPLLRDLNPAVPEPLEQVTMRALAKSPDARYQTADEFRADLERFVEGRPVLAGAVAGGTVAATSVVGAATTSVLPQGDTTMAVPSVARSATDAAVVAAVPVATSPPASLPPAARDDEDDVAPRRSPRSPAAWVAVLLVVALIAVGFFAYRALAGSSTVAVPSVVNEPVATATNQISSLGLKFTSTTRSSTTVTTGDVISVTPRAGTQVQPGSSVKLVVSSGPPVPVTVPPVVGSTLEAATTALNAVGLGYTTRTVQSWTSPVMPGTVLEQTPSANSMADTGSKVVLTFLGPGGTYPLPSLVDDTPAAAGAALGSYGLTLSSTQGSVCTSAVAKGNVASTSPPQGTSVTQGSVVALTISTGACPVVVPDVVTLSVAAAESAIENAQLNPVLEQCPSGEGSTGIIASQSPLGETKATPGSNVEITPGCTATTTTTTTTTTIPPGTVVGGRAHDDHHRDRTRPPVRAHPTRR